MFQTSLSPFIETNKRIRLDIVVQPLGINSTSC